MIIPDLHHPITDLDARFAATTPEDTYTLMEALRKAGINFDVTINGPKDDPNEQDYDIFWFRKQDDQERIASILRATIPSKADDSHANEPA
jgi:hypothetical protein